MWKMRDLSPVDQMDVALGKAAKQTRIIRAQAAADRMDVDLKNKLWKYENSDGGIFHASEFFIYKTYLEHILHLSFNLDY